CFSMYIFMATFIGLIMNSKCQQTLISIAENLLESCKEPLHLNDQTIYFSFSVGIALSQFASSPEDFIMQADQAMYKAKTSEQHWFIYKPEN
ncbi:diguanylate cyclase domain-containing protein, partial [Acinetobacter baumannii]